MANIHLAEKPATVTAGVVPEPVAEGERNGRTLEERLRWFPPNTHITVRGLDKRFGAEVIYDKFDLNIPRGKITSIFGPNGCGKSTLVNIISGLIPYEGGQILFDGKTLDETRIGYVFQNYREALFPWMRAVDNIHYPLKLMGVPAKERKRRVDALIESFDVPIDFSSYPYQLSGGQMQTICIMRALVVEPEVLFLDEPFSALDYEMSLLMRDRVQRIFQERGTTMVIVSHDLEDAVWLSDYVLLLTRKPTRIAEFVEYDAPRPRTDDTVSDAKFIRVKKRCLDIFLKEAALR
ncbi:MAG: ABC transporter ATP-binding protein [Ectothiorhodospiraceae bacterium]|nr:ABC transporter ATP-binding protein [Ectothiorhodospiraceae bacterium]MCH8504652.1 ABC transporter ATP-binding protein [Ectothiorhodospiraceae bacterium]